MARQRFATDRHQPDGDWVQASMLFDVAGVFHRRAIADEFASAASAAEEAGRAYGVEFRLEPQNKHDPNAIMVMGFADTKGFWGAEKRRRWHIGYVPAHIAAELQEGYVRQNIALDCELYGISYSDDGEYLDIGIIALAPPGHSLSSRIRETRKVETEAELGVTTASFKAATFVIDLEKSATSYFHLAERLRQEKREVEGALVLVRMVHASKGQKEHWAPPAAFDRLAAYCRKKKNFTGERAILEEFASKEVPRGRTGEKLTERLAQLRREGP